MGPIKSMSTNFLSFRWRTVYWFCLLIFQFLFQDGGEGKWCKCVPLAFVELAHEFHPGCKKIYFCYITCEIFYLMLSRWDRVQNGQDSIRYDVISVRSCSSNTNKVRRYPAYIHNEDNFVCFKSISKYILPMQSERM